MSRAMATPTKQPPGGGVVEGSVHDRNDLSGSFPTHHNYHLAPVRLHAPGVFFMNPTKRVKPPACSVCGRRTRLEAHGNLRVCRKCAEAWNLAMVSG